MKKTILLWILLAGWGLIFDNQVFGQAVDTLTDDEIYEMKSSAERTLQDYASAMRELINPRISKAFRERMINEFVTPGNRQIFVDSAYIVYDYEPEHLPPQTMKERPVRIYLNDFNAFYQGNDSQDRMSVYFSLRRIHDIEWNGDGYYIVLDFESQYGDQIPQPRRATLQLIRRDGDWEALINYVKFNVEEETLSEPPTAREAMVPQWRILAEQADTLLQAGNLAEAKVRLDSSLAIIQEPYNAQLLGQYYQQQGDLDAALFSYQQSIALGTEADSTYRDPSTQARIDQIQEQQLAAQQAEEARLRAQRLEEERLAREAEEERLREQESVAEQEEPVEETATPPAVPKVDFANVANSYRQGKEYTVRWSGVIYDPLTLELLQNGKYVQTLRAEILNSAYTWEVPKTLEKGDNYQFRLVKPGTEAGANSPTFSIRRKTPFGIYVGASVGIGAALYFLLRDDPEGTNPIGLPPSPK